MIIITTRWEIISASDMFCVYQSGDGKQHRLAFAGLDLLGKRPGD
jgi:hypothetical protein